MDHDNAEITDRYHATGTAPVTGCQGCTYS